jgi:hypothetical protein
METTPFNASTTTSRNDTSRSKTSGVYDEGPVARTIEKQTAKLPSDVFLWAAGAAILGSLALQVRKPSRTAFLTGSRRSGELSTFVGQWAPTLLLLGIYNKIVKVAGSDRNHN